jgi:DNA-binding CsgD family transcriptional regulator
VSVPVANSLPSVPARAHAILSARELDYLARLAMNEPRKLIAYHDGITRWTVDEIVNRALRKLGSDSLIDAYRALGWLKPGGSD